MKRNNNILGVGIISAIASSLCCITPLLVILSGSSGYAATFSWMEPFRPYLIAFTVFVLAFAWFQQLKTKKSIPLDCDCERSGAASFFQGKFFLAIVTVFVVVMLTVPYFSDAFYPDNKKEIHLQQQADVQQINLAIEGMTCTACEAHVNYEINELEGIVSVVTSYDDATTTVTFDKTKTSLKQIEKAVNNTGYKAALITKQ
ncbi:MAG: heavy metal transporter [Flavobacteriaceae bacterium]|nr:MAG: heavy metal transporter [Flavobacteriaceae bacterium]